MRIIAVVMGEPDSKTRNKEVSEMLDYAFAQYKIDNLLNENSSLGKYEVTKSKEKYIKVVPKEDVTILRKKSEKSGNAVYEVKLNELKAPIKKGDNIGKLNIKENGKTIRTINLTTSKNIQKANIFQLYIRYLKEIFTGSITI